MAEKKSEKLISMQHAYSAPQSNKRGRWNNGAYLELVRIGHFGPQSGRHYLVFQQLLCNYVIITTITINFPACYYESRCTLTHLTFILAALKNRTSQKSMITLGLPAMTLSAKVLLYVQCTLLIFMMKNLCACEKVSVWLQSFFFGGSN